MLRLFGWVRSASEARMSDAISGFIIPGVAVPLATRRSELFRLSEIRLTFRRIRSMMRPSRLARRGALWPIVTEREAGCDGRFGSRVRFAHADERCRGGRRSRVVLTPRRWCQARGDDPRATGARKPGSLGRARRKPLKPSCGECRMIWLNLW